MKVAFLDRDGTLIVEPPGGLVQPKDFRILPGVLNSLKQLQDNDYHLVMVTNQNFSVDPYNEECYKKTQEMLVTALTENGITFDEMFCCPHATEQGCNCQKPKTGMVDEFLKNNDVDLSHSFMVGDRMTDGEFAINIGVRFYKMEPNDSFPEFSKLAEYNQV